MQPGGVGKGPPGQVGVLPELRTGVAVAWRARRTRGRARGTGHRNIMVVVEDGLLGMLGVEGILRWLEYTRVGVLCV